MKTIKRVKSKQTPVNDSASGAESIHTSSYHWQNRMSKATESDISTYTRVENVSKYAVTEINNWVRKWTDS